MNFYDVLGDFAQRSNQIELTLKMDSAEQKLYRQVIDEIDPTGVEKLQESFLSDLQYFLSDSPNVDRAGPEKYFDIPYFIATRIRPILELDIINCAHKDILDIGVGPGHFAAICNSLGHRTLGIDVDCRYYAELCDALGVERNICPVYRFENLPDLGRKFDLVTAIWICFDQLGEDQRGHRIYWSNKEWKFFIEDLFGNHIKPNGAIYLVLNAQVGKDGASAFDSDFLDWACNVGAEVDRRNGTIFLRRDSYNVGDFQKGLVGNGVNQISEIASSTADSSCTSVEPLIFESTSLLVNAFESLGSSSDYFTSVQPWETDLYTVLGTFSTPGQIAPALVNGIHFEPKEVHFDNFGEYYFTSQIGAFKVLILDPNLNLGEKILKIFGFVTKNCVHSLADYWKYQVRGINQPFDFSSLARKLFFSDQPLMLHCGGASEFLITIFHHYGIEARLVHMLRGEGLDGHVVVEALDRSKQKWIYLDPDYGVALQREDEFLSVDDLVKCIAQENPLFSVVDFGKKFWLKPEYNFPLKFVGDCSWMPAINSDSPCGNELMYMGIMKTYAKIINRYNYEFDSTWRGRRILNS